MSAISTVLNNFGLTKFGVNRFGSNDDSSGKKKFRVYLNKELKINPFYNAQIEFISDGSNQQWEVLVFGFEVKLHSEPKLRKLFKNFK